ncbi:MAG: 3-oxoacyl-ACP reductase FabG [Chloroflexi bacterium]|nr:3-oxoacyl-ACP reductase FabG [Chloroflexota bacterium]
MDAQRFAGQVALVTGASKGIGRAVAEGFAREGAAVILNYRSDDEGAQEALAQIQGAGGRAWLVKADVSQPDEVRRLVAEAEQQVKQVDILVNNAAIVNRRHFFEVTPDDLGLTLDTNVKGLYLLSQLIARGMAERKKGVIIHLSSILARLAVEKRTAYCASKGAIEGLTRAMALDLAPYNIRVNAVSPGLIRTEALLAGMPVEAVQAEVQRYISTGRFGDPQELAQVVLFLASDEARYINGAVIPVDSGLGAREAGPLPKA